MKYLLIAALLIGGLLAASPGFTGSRLPASPAASTTPSPDPYVALLAAAFSPVCKNHGSVFSVAMIPRVVYPAAVTCSDNPKKTYTVTGLNFH